jgi:Uma2 family endonuclease
MAEAHSARRQFTHEDVLRMLEAGILSEDEPLELIDGELIIMSPQGPRHRMLVVAIHQLLERTYGPGHHVQDHSPILASHNSMPEPDVAVIRGEVRQFTQHLPAGSDVVLAVEISDTTLAQDRAKASVYARADIPEYWIVNLQDRQLERYSHPVDGVYGRTLVLKQQESVSPPGHDTTAWRVAELLD